MKILNSNKIFLFCSQARLEEQTVEEPKVKTVPFIDMKPEPVEVEEGKPAKFMVKVSGFPRPRVNWFVNGSLVVGVSTLITLICLNYFMHKCSIIVRSVTA